MSKIRGKDIIALGYPKGTAVQKALHLLSNELKGIARADAFAQLKMVLDSPENFLAHHLYADIAAELVEVPSAPFHALRSKAIPYEVFGSKGIEQGALDQMQTAMQLPIAEAGALMPDAHYGYGLPIGGVLATKNAVIPYGVGVDIGCRMCLSVFDLPITTFEKRKKSLKNILGKQSKFGREFHQKTTEHPIFERTEFKEIEIAKQLRSRAVKQLGSSGGGNHFVEFGIVDITDANNEFGLAIGTYFALLSHSGSRGLGANIANYYTQKAREQCKLPKVAEHLAWLNLEEELGAEYWLAMNLAGDYASACHHDIHARIQATLGAEQLMRVENHHNFAWKEMVNGEEMVVHRKGATPAGKGDLGIIPGSMIAPGFIVRGKGSKRSLNSASHGAGRKLSRRKALKSFNYNMLRAKLKEANVTLLGAGLDEAPMAYKNIHEVIAAQKSLIEVLGTFTPKVVRMAK